MGLTETQTALARLLTDEAIRIAFFAEPETVGRIMGLTAAETESLVQITGATADAMARSLHAKRRNEIAKLMPRTAAGLADRFALLFRKFAANYVPHGVNKHAQDAVAFSRFLRQSTHWRNMPAELRAVLHYETALLTLADRRFLIRFFTHDVRIGAVPIQSRQAALWFRPRTNATWRVLWLHAPNRSNATRSKKAPQT